MLGYKDSNSANNSASDLLAKASSALLASSSSILCFLSALAFAIKWSDCSDLRVVIMSTTSSSLAFNSACSAEVVVVSTKEVISVSLIDLANDLATASSEKSPDRFRSNRSSVTRLPPRRRESIVI